MAHFLLLLQFQRFSLSAGACWTLSDIMLLGPLSQGFMAVCTSQTQANAQYCAFVCFRGWYTHFDGGGLQVF